jgi:hypothetical protein
MVKVETVINVVCCAVTCIVAWKMYVMLHALQPIVTVFDVVRWFVPR